MANEKVDCPDCDGSGKVPYTDGKTSGMKRCQRCSGTGKITINNK